MAYRHYFQEGDFVRLRERWRNPGGRVTTRITKFGKVEKVTLHRIAVRLKREMGYDMYLTYFKPDKWEFAPRIFNEYSH